MYAEGPMFVKTCAATRKASILALRSAKLNAAGTDLKVLMKVILRACTWKVHTETENVVAESTRYEELCTQKVRFLAQFKAFRRLILFLAGSSGSSACTARSTQTPSLTTSIRISGQTILS